METNFFSLDFLLKIIYLLLMSVFIFFTVIIGRQLKIISQTYEENFNQWLFLFNNLFFYFGLILFIFGIFLL